MGIIDFEQLHAELFKKDIRGISSVHHIDVDLPHPPAGIDRFLEIVQKLDVRGGFNVESFQTIIPFQYFLYITSPEPIVVLHKRPDGLPELFLPFGFLLIRIDHEEAEITSSILEPPVPSFHCGKRKGFGTVLHPVPAKVDPKPSKHRRPWRDGMRGIKKPSGRLL